jgi:ABC-type lipoprotein export system ATPase subunit
VSDTGAVQELRARLFEPQPPVIELVGIGRRFGVDPPLDALINVHLEVRQGEWLAVVGPSGSGKSTLLNIMGLLDVPTAGIYRFDGLDVSGLSDAQRAGLRSRGIGFVFQSFHLIAHRSVLENVMLSDVYRMYPRRERAERAASALAQVGLGHRMEYLPTRLSGGERQRAAIARAIMGSPRILLCDEPTGNLDSVTSAAIMQLFDDLNRGGLTIVAITHEATVAEHANRQVRIVDGKLEDYHEPA